MGFRMLKKLLLVWLVLMVPWSADAQSSARAPPVPGVARQWTGVASGVNTYTVTTVERGFTVGAGKRFWGTFVSGNTGAATLNLDSTKALPIRKPKMRAEIDLWRS